MKIPDLSLKTLLIVPFVLQLFGAIGAVGYISYTNSQGAVNDVAQQLREELSLRIREELEDYTSVPHAINRINTEAVREGTLDIDKILGERQFWVQMRSFRNISYIYCGNERGAFMGVARLNEADDLQRQRLFVQYSNPETQFMRRLFRLDDRGQRTERIPPPNTRPFDPRQRPWYIAGKARQGIGWSDIYLDFSTQLPTVTATAPIFRRTDNRLIGVCAVDFYLPKEMSIFLGKLKVGKTDDRGKSTGVAFIVEKSGRLVASSQSEPVTTGTQENTKLIAAVDSPNPVIQATTRFLTEKFGKVSEISTAEQLDFELGGQKQFVQVIPFQDNNLEWWIVVTISEADYLTRIYATTRQTLWLSLASLTIALGVGILTVGRIARPIESITNASQVIATGDLNEQIQPSIIHELRILGNSFSHMRDSLKIYISELEHTTAVKQKIESELAIATQIQLSMLPKLDQDADNRYDIATILQPARQVGGDLYDFMMLDDRRLLLMIGDVAGKGVPAALMVSRTITLMRMIAKNMQIASAHQILEALNAELSIDNDECIFVTVFCAILNLETGFITYASGGHDAPVLMRAGRANFLELETGMPLGIEEETDFPEQEFQLQTHDLLLLYTDGITEAMNEQEELFGDRRLLDCLTKDFPSSAGVAIHTVEFFHQQHIQSAEQSDDLTLLAIQFQGAVETQPWQIQISNQLTDLDRLQMELGAFLQKERLSIPQIHDAQLIVEEVLVNVISYAYPDQTDQVIELKVIVDSQQLKMVFQDTGTPFNPLLDQAMPNLDELDDTDRESGGLGIYLVRKLSQHIDYQFTDGHNVLTVICALRPSRPNLPLD